MKQIRLILVIALGVMFTLSVGATTVVTEQFQDYQSGELGSSPSIGNTGIVPGNWASGRVSIVVTNGTGSLDGTGLGLVESAGDKAIILPTYSTNFSYVATLGNTFDTNSSGEPNGAYMVFANKNAPPPAFPGTNAVDLYTSFLYQFNDSDPTNFPAGGAAYIAAFNRQNSGIQSSAKGYWQLFARPVGGGNIQLGIAKNTIGVIPVPGVTNWAATTVTNGQTFLVVVELEIMATNSTSEYTNDVVNLWINPPPQYLGTNEANVPSPDATSPASDGQVDSSTTGPGRFVVFDNGPSAYLDELRIGTNWASVTPWYGQCLPAGFTDQPTNTSVVGGISATFYTKSADSTAPTYQWQISQDGGATWSDIANSVQRAYTTPNLQYPGDNGNQYRAIATVSCDGSSVTSSVATVTVTAPSPTPNGLIMDDTFSDGIRMNTPVTANNSVWYTDSAYTSDLDASSGQLVGTPVSGSSTLWLGYFVDESSSLTPVDLAVGQQITVTLNFIPSSFSSFTNNGALRLGLFDYADAGTFLTADSGSLTGSGGAAAGVRGYMLSLDFGTNFTDNTPLNLYARTALNDNNLMGTTGDYTSIGSGPIGSGPIGLTYSNTPAFKAGINYTLTFTVARMATNNCTVTAQITGGDGMNLSASTADTNSFGYHRFDIFAIRPNKLENAPDQIIMPEFKVQVGDAPTPLSNFKISSISRGVVDGTNDVTLTWTPTPSVNGGLYFIQRSTNLNDSVWTPVQENIPGTNYTFFETNATTVFYRMFGQ